MIRLALVTIALFLAGVAAALALGRRESAPPVVVRVTMEDFRFVLSRRHVPVGTVKFVVVNRGAIVHDFAVGHAKTRLLQPGKQQTIVVRFARAGRFAYRCTVGGHAKLGMKGTFVVGSPKPPPTTTTTTTTTTAPTPTGLQLTPVGTFDRPDLVTSPPGDTKRVFVVEQRGVIRVIDDGVLEDTPFLDISDQVQIESETGLLGVAFAPDYAESGLFYVFFNRHEGNGNLYLEEFHRSANDLDQADPYSGRVVLTIVKPWENHNGGMLQFGPDGYLYVSVGDGDSGVLNPPGAFAQTLDDLLGNVLRIDPHQTEDGAPYSVPESNPFVDLQGARPEIWAYGFRNPWRFWVDPATGALLVGDVGEGAREEIDLIPAGKGGLNFGWPCFEGTVPFDQTATCPNAVAPILDYNHDTDLCAVVGGVALHDPRLPSLDGAFLFGDLCGGEVRALRIANGAVAANDDLKLNVPGLDSFGMDALGRAYAVSLTGAVFRIDPASG